MAVPDPQAGRAFIWLISCFLFFFIAVGGSCLIAYMVLPYSPPWVPYVGIAFVCLPWLFWIITFLYRILSRAFGFRMVIGSGGGGGGNVNTRTAGNNDSSVRQVEVEERAGEGEHNGDNRSVTSHESEMPLAISMAA